MSATPARPSRSRFVEARGVRFHVREWGAADAPAILMLHGWMDVSASFQFVVDALRVRWRVLAPDWRGYGLTTSAAADCYWFADHLADLDFLGEALSPDAPMRLVGHSMGGNIALMYAGIRPARVAAVINLEGFGLRDSAATEAPARYARWMDELKKAPTLRDYASLDEVAQRLRRTNPRLSGEAARFLAQHWSQPGPNGRRRVAADPAHRIVNPVLYRLAEVEACWQQVACPVLWVRAAQTDAIRWAGDAAELQRRSRVFRNVRHAVVEDAGHMLHHDQPAKLAALIEEFLAGLATQ
jgi:pimeloyl-ACP methyl ester carboxylesterase